MPYCKKTQNKPPIHMVRPEIKIKISDLTYNIRVQILKFKQYERHFGIYIG